MEYIEHIYYINLDYRTDRREEFEKEMSDFDIEASKITRIPARSIPQLGVLGCAVSHIQALDTFLQSSFSVCLILEDDFEWTVDREYFEELLLPVFEEKIQFDSIMLAGNVKNSEPTEWPFLSRVLDAQTTAGYIITREFAPVLRENLIESTQLLWDWFEQTGEKKHEYCLDIYWKKLQQMSNWFILDPKVGMQRESYSDIEHKIVNYGV